MAQQGRLPTAIGVVLPGKVGIQTGRDLDRNGVAALRCSGEARLANLYAIQSIGESLRLYLQATYPASLQAAYPCTFQVLSSGQLAQFQDPTESSVAVTLYLYRSTHSEFPRVPRGNLMGGAEGVLSLDLHWLVAVWSSSAAAEQVVHAWLLRQLYLSPVLDSGRLTPEGGWSTSEAVQLIPEELPVETLMRLWEAFEPSYRLSSCYVARVVRVGDSGSDAIPVVATRLELSAGKDGT